MLTIPMRPLYRIAYIALACLFVSCGDNSSPKTTPSSSAETSSDTITVAVAASMRYAFEEVVEAFEKQHPEITVKPSFGASGTFYAQLVQQAPFDLFLSADTKYPEQLVSEGHAKEAFPYATGRLVLWALKSADLGLAERGIEVLKDPRVNKISIANPELAPYGRAAEETMKHFGVSDETERKLVRAENIGQAAQFVQSGAAQVGFLAYSLTLVGEMKDTGDLWLVPPTAHQPLLQGGVILPWAQHPEQTEALRDFLVGPEGQTILARHGFGSPIGSPAETP